MVSSFTTNKSIEKPGNNDYIDTWNVPVNSDWDIIDAAFGGQTSLNVTGISATPVNLSASQYRPLILSVSGTLTANVTYVIPAGVGGQWIAANNTTGAFTLTFASGGAGTSATVTQGSIVSIASDGTNVRLISTQAAGANTQIQFNSANTFGASSSLTFDGATLATNQIAATGNVGIGGALAVTGAITTSSTITAAGNITAFSDERLKSNIKTIENALDLVGEMRGVSYIANNTGLPSIGVVAQEIQKIVPEVVQDNNGMLSVAYGNIVGVLIEAIKELKDKVKELESK